MSIDNKKLIISKLCTLVILLTSFISTSQQTPYSDIELSGLEKPKASNNPYLLKEEVYAAFQQMQKAAALEHIYIKVVSSFRSFERQQQIWNRKYKRYTSQGLSPEDSIKKIIEYSTLPGTSRHHWGTDIDIVLDLINPPPSLLIPENFDNDKPFYILKKWLDANANRFGFELVYTNIAERTGFKYEPWHYSYAPTSKIMLTDYLECQTICWLDHINTLGSQYLSPKFIEEYLSSHILGINPTLLPQ